MRKDGFIELDDYDYRKVSYYYYVININNNKYYFKKSKSIRTVYNELIAEELAKDYGIENVKYDLASLDGFIGVISEDFIKDRSFIYIGSLLAKFHKNEFIPQYNNLKDLQECIMKKYGDKSLFDSILDMFIFDMLIGNVDRHTDNYGLFVDNNISLATIFDNEYMLDPRSVYDGTYSIGIDRDDYYKKDDITFKALSEYDLYDRLVNKIEIINESNMKRVLDRVESKINSKIDSDIKKEILSRMSDNNNRIKKNIKLYSLGV